MVTRFKARLVAKGFSQIRGIDYKLIFFPTLSIESMKFIISLAAKFHWNIFQLDIKAACLNAKLRLFLLIFLKETKIMVRNIGN